MAKRPAGISFLAIYYLLASALMLLPAAFFLFLALAPERFLGLGAELPSFSNPVAQFFMWFVKRVFLDWFVAAFSLGALAAGYAAIGLGLFRLRKWARFVALGFAGAELLYFAVSIYMLFPLPPDQGVVTNAMHVPVVLIDVWTLWYLFRPRISQAFGTV